MNDELVEMWAHSLLLKIHVITGWTIPDSEELMNILTDQFQKSLVEKYYMLNTDEIEYAFRNNGTMIKDWGKAMNLNLLDKVLVPYIHNRLQISEAERILNTKKDYTQKIFTQQEIEDSAREDAERNYQLFKKGYRIKNQEINKDILSKDKLISEGETVVDFFFKKAESGASNIYIKNDKRNT